MKKSTVLAGLVFAMMGAMVLLNTLDKPGVEALRGVDVLRLASSGGLFGVAIMILSSWFRHEKS